MTGPAAALDAEVTAVVSTYLALADAEAPGLVEGLYVIGSAAMADYRPGRSDVDVVVVTATPPDGPGLAALGRTHAQVRTRYRRPTLDGPYLTWAELGRHPDAARDAPYAHEGRFHPTGRFELNPVTWHTLADQGIVCRGPAPDNLTVWTDRAVLRSWAADNLATYWRRWRERSGRWTSGLGIKSSARAATEWGVLGAARQHHTAAYGHIFSKTAAARYALEVFDDQWSPIIREARYIRTGAGRPSYRGRWARRRDLLAFLDMVIADVREHPWPTS